MILLAVALFGALYVAVTGSDRGNKDASEEISQMIANTLIQYGANLEQATSRVILTNGCNENQISFSNSSLSGYVNINSPSDKRCHIFDPAGAGLNVGNFPISFFSDDFKSSPSFSKHYFSAFFTVKNVATECEASSCIDLVLLVPNISHDVCKRINISLGIPAPKVVGITNLSTSQYEPEKFTGSYRYVNTGSHLGDMAYSTRRAGCFLNAVAPMTPIFYYVLLAR